MLPSLLKVLVPAVAAAALAVVAPAAAAAAAVAAAAAAAASAVMQCWLAYTPAAVAAACFYDKSRIHSNVKCGCMGRPKSSNVVS